MVSPTSLGNRDVQKLTPPLQLSKEDEEGDGVEVRREDQDKINKFSRLHQRETALKEELQLKSVNTHAFPHDTAMTY